MNPIQAIAFVLIGAAAALAGSSMGHYYAAKQQHTQRAVQSYGAEEPAEQAPGEHWRATQRPIFKGQVRPARGHTDVLLEH